MTTIAVYTPEGRKIGTPADSAEVDSGGNLVLSSSETSEVITVFAAGHWAHWIRRTPAAADPDES